MPNTLNILSNTDRFEKKTSDTLLSDTLLGALPLSIIPHQPLTGTGRTVNDKTQLSLMAANSKTVFNIEIILRSTTACASRNILFTKRLTERLCEGDNSSASLPSALPRSYNRPGDPDHRWGSTSLSLITSKKANPITTWTYQIYLLPNHFYDHYYIKLQEARARIFFFFNAQI